MACPLPRRLSSMFLPLLALSAAALAQTPDPRLPTVFLIGDSTASNTGGKGWGDHLANYFDTAKVNVVNRSRAGRGSRTFLTEGLWDKVKNDLKSGDFVFIQFGHNDGGPPDRDRARGSLPGLGGESKEFTLPNGNKEVVYTFGHYMREFIRGAESRGATPVLLSLTVRNIWKDGKVERGSGRFGGWTQELASTAGVAFLDVTNIIADRYESMGEEKVKALFPIDHTHTSVEGAALTASLVVAALNRIPSHPLLAFLIAKRSINPALPSLFLIGDSTVRNGRGDGGNGQWGWGEPLVAYFDTTRLNVVNRALGGLSSRTYYTMGHWDRVKAILKRGDIVIIQFGHNDNGPLDDTARARGTIKGVGEETREIDNPLTGKHETVHSYGWYLRRFITETHAAGATPIICSPVPRKIWRGGRIARSQDYAAWAREVAAAGSAHFVDLNSLIADRYDELGPVRVDPLFADEHTHTTWAGAELNASALVKGLNQLPRNPLAGYLRERRP
ncbi:MAG: GDSL family lipase [Acidobacteria bacterium]|nr:GDSL family lipase [Acidobacteriota bacterium]